MDRIKKLGKYQKAVLLALVVIIAVFTVIYAVTISRVGYLYHETIFVPEKVDGTTIYSANYRGNKCRFIVSDDDSIVFETAGSKYGPYSFREDPTAIPTGSGFADVMKGLEVKYDNKVIFRGGVVKVSDRQYWVYNEDGTLADKSSPLDGDHEVIVDGNGKVIDRNTLFVCGITDLMLGPELTHLGSWLAWFGNVVYCAIIAASVIYADELFRWNLSFQIKNYDKAEPADWEITGRYFAWAAFTIMAVYLFMLGLKP